MIVSCRIVCRTKASKGEKVGQVSVEVSGGEFGLSQQIFSFQVMRGKKKCTANALFNASLPSHRQGPILKSGPNWNESKDLLQRRWLHMIYSPWWWNQSMLRSFDFFENQNNKSFFHLMSEPSRIHLWWECCPKEVRKLAEQLWQSLAETFWQAVLLTSTSLWVECPVTCERFKKFLVIRGLTLTAARWPEVQSWWCDWGTGTNS